MKPVELIEDCRKQVEAGRWAVPAIVGSDASDWAYTVGLERNLEHPELIVVGFEARVGAALLHSLACRISEGDVFETGREYEGIFRKLPARFVEVGDLWVGQGDWFNLGREVMTTWGERWPRTLQLLWPDRHGVFPDEREAGPEWGFIQPVLRENEHQPLR